MIKSHKKIISKRKSRKPIFKKKWFWDLILFFIFFSSLSWLIFKTPYFEIKTIKVSALPDFIEKIQEISSKEKNFFLFNTARVSDDIKNSFPEIKEIVIKKHFPHTILIETKQREEIGIFCLGEDNNPCFLIADDGVIFKNTEIKEGLLLFSKPDEKTPPPLGSVIIEKEKLSDLLFLVNEAKNINVNIIKIEILQFEIRAFTQNNFKIYLSKNADIKKQTLSLINIYQKIISDKERESLEYIDLRNLKDGEKGGVYWK